MIVGKDFELIFFINLSVNQNARFLIEGRLAELGIDAERFPMIHGDSISPRYISKRATDLKWQYARLLTIRLALREARKRKVKSVCIFEDDVIFHPNFTEICKMVQPPEGWGVFYFGCNHEENPELVDGRIVRVRRGFGSHAFGVHGREINKLLNWLRKGPIRGVDYCLDRILADAQKSMSSYCCFPNLVWIPKYAPKENGKYKGEYLSDGMQKMRPMGLSNIFSQMVRGLPSCGSDAPLEVSSNPFKKIAFLFLTRGDLNLPRVWAEYFYGHENRVIILTHPKYPKQINSSVLKNTVIKDLLKTGWGEISLVQATRNLILKALENQAVTHLVLVSESCVPIQPLAALLKRLQIDPRSRFRYSTYDRANPTQRSRAKRILEIPVGCWIFQSQWWLMDRALASFAVLQDFSGLFEKVVAPDEMYFGTVLSYQGVPLEGNVVNQAITWTWWEQGSGSPNSWPTLNVKKFGSMVLEDLVNSGAFFARKFPPEADIGKYGFHLE